MLRVALIKLLQIKNPIRWINFATQFPQFRTNLMFLVDRITGYTLSASKQNGVQNLFMANRNFK